MHGIRDSNHPFDMFHIQHMHLLTFYSFLPYFAPCNNVSLQPRTILFSLSFCHIFRSLVPFETSNISNYVVFLAQFYTINVTQIMTTKVKHRTIIQYQEGTKNIFFNFFGSNKWNQLFVTAEILCDSHKLICTLYIVHKITNCVFIVRLNIHMCKVNFWAVPDGPRSFCFAVNV